MSCDFVNFSLGSSGRLYTLYDNSGDGMTLDINTTSNSFAEGSRVILSGKNGSSFGAGSRGGSAGVINWTARSLFDTRFAMFEGIGGKSTLISTVGGKGGTLQLNFFGLIRNFTDSEYSYYDPELDVNIPYSSNIPILSGGENSVGEKSGENGKLIYNKKECFAFTNMNLSDVDINGDGKIDAGDLNKIKDNYAVLFGEENYSVSYDINCDDRLNIQDLARIGFKWETR